MRIGASCFGVGFSARAVGDGGRCAKVMVQLLSGSAVTAFMKPGAPHHPTSSQRMIERIIRIVLLAGLAATVLFLALVWVSAGRPETPHIRIEIADIANLKSALYQFEIDTGRYPTGDEGLEALVLQPVGLTTWSGPYIEEVPVDKWGHAYRYVCPVDSDANKFNIISAGADGVFGTEDDVDCFTK